MSHKKFYFLRLVKLELKPHPKDLKNPFPDMALKDFCVTTLYCIF